MGRPLWTGTARGAFFFASTRVALELAAQYAALELRLRQVPPGTEGAISAEGTSAGFVAALILAAVGAAGGLYGWGLAVLVATAGLLGSLGESVLGTMAERRGWLDNDLLNAVNTALGAGLVVLMARVAA